MTKIRIVVDKREKSSVPKELEKLGANLLFETLPTGDYQVSDEMAFEYKSCGDFLSSEVGEEKLKLNRQVIDLVAGYPKPALLIGGTIQELLYLRRINPNAILAMIQSIIWIGCPVRFLVNEKIVANYIYECAKKEQEPHELCRYFNHHGFKTSLTHEERACRIIEWLPGVGDAKAHELYNKFGSVEAVITAKTDELMTVDGIGKKIAKDIRDAVTIEKKIPIFL